MAIEQKDSILKNISRYSSSYFYQNVLGFISAIIKPMLLKPELYGLWNLLTLISYYAHNTDLGTHGSMRYLIPFNKSKKEYQKINEIKGSTYFGSLYLRIFFVTILLIVSLMLDIDLKVRVGLFTIAIVIILEWYHEYYISLLKSYENFRLITKARYLWSTIMFVLSIILIYLFNIYGMYITIIISYLSVIAYLRVKSPLDSHTRFQFHLFKDLVKIGFPIMLFNLFMLLITSTDRIIVSAYLGIEQLGYYGIVVMVFNFLMQMPGVVIDVIEPRLMSRTEKDSQEEILNQYFFKPIINTAYFMPFFIAPVFFVLPIIISLILPRYIDSIIPVQIMVFGGYFLSMSYMTRGFIVANNWQFKVLVWMVFGLVINIILTMVLLIKGMGLQGVVLGSSISYFILFLSLILFIRKRCNYALRDWRKNLIGISWPFLITCALIGIIECVSGFVSINAYTDPFVKLAIFYIIMFYVVNIFQKKYSLLKKIEIKHFYNKVSMPFK
jgi:O-antigen/teichoic acid export membrane protein